MDIYHIWTVTWPLIGVDFKVALRSDQVGDIQAAAVPLEVTPATLFNDAKTKSNFRVSSTSCPLPISNLLSTRRTITPNVILHTEFTCSEMEL